MENSDNYVGVTTIKETGKEIIWILVQFNMFGSNMIKI